MAPRERNTVKCTLVILLTLQQFTTTAGLLYIVRQSCTRGQVFTPVPSTVNGICLQCVCVMANISYCKPLIVQLSVVCSAAIVVPAATVAPTVAPTTAPVATTPTAAPTIPAATATTSVGINPRASTPGASAMMSGSPTTLMVMAAAGTAGMSVAAATPPPAG